MIGRRPSGQRMRSGLTVIELLVAIAVLGLFEALLLTSQTPAPQPPLSFAEPVSPAVVPAESGGELSLQTTLDRLGFTVNVPQEYQGRRLANWGPGRVSTRSDEGPSGWFEANGPVQFAEVSRQSTLGSVTTFAAETTDGDEIQLFRPLDSADADRLLSRPQPRVWSCPYAERVSPSAARTAAVEIHGTFRFSIDFPADSFGRGPLLSTAADNPDGASLLLVLPARKGGTWVDEGENTGHWEGGVADGTYLLCWEDTVHGDNDFQDLVIYAKGIRPARR